MKFSVKRESLLGPLQQVVGVVDRRPTLPILSNILLQVENDELSLTGTDLEVEMVGKVAVSETVPGAITVQARKLMDICRQLSENAQVLCEVELQRLKIKSGKFNSTLATLDARDFPAITRTDDDLTVSINGKKLKHLLDCTGFAMAQQDVRVFFNGMLLEIGGGQIKAIATDRHRLALNSIAASDIENDKRQVILPRKGVMELQSLLQGNDEEVSVSIGSNHLSAASGQFNLTSKLVDGQYPDYERVIPRDGDKTILAEKETLKQALGRTAILSNEQFRAIRVSLSEGTIQLSANNSEQEEAEETVLVEYQGDKVDIGFDVRYLQDVLSVMDGEKVRITVKDANSSALLEEPENDNAVYVVMPMKL